MQVLFLISPSSIHHLSFLLQLSSLVSTSSPFIHSGIHLFALALPLNLHLLSQFSRRYLQCQSSMPISILRSFIQQILPHSSLTQVNTNKQTIDPIHSFFLFRCRSPSMIRMIDCSTMLCNCIPCDRHTRRHLSFLFGSPSSTPSHRLDTVRVRHCSSVHPLSPRSRHRRSFDPRLFITLSRRVRFHLRRRRSSIFSVRRVPISRSSTRSPRSSARSVRRWRRNVDRGRRRN